MQGQVDEDENKEQKEEKILRASSEQKPDNQTIEKTLSANVTNENVRTVVVEAPKMNGETRDLDEPMDPSNPGGICKFSRDTVGQNYFWPI